MGKLIGAGVLFSVAAFMILGFLGSATAMTLPVAVITWGVAVGIPVAGGLGLIHLYRKERGAQSETRADVRRQTWEAEVVRLAGRKSGRLTVVELVGELGLSAEEAQETLESLMNQGIGDIEITESGLLVYRFEDVQRLKDKSQSRPILE